MRSVEATALLAEVDVVDLAQLGPRLDAGELAELVRCVLMSESATGSWSVAIVLTSDDHLRQLHRDFMGIDEETDVMTFPSEARFDQAGGGDIVISVDRAAINAESAGQRVEREIRFLVAHGVLHLRGWDDQTDERRAAMLRRQESLLESFETGER